MPLKYFFILTLFFNCIYSDETITEIKIEDMISQATTKEVKAKIASSGNKLLITINSPGGYLEECIQISDMLNKSKKHISIYISKEALGGAALIAMSANQIYMSDKSTIGDCVPFTVSIKPEISIKAKKEVINTVKNFKRIDKEQRPYFLAMVGKYDKKLSGIKKTMEEVQKDGLSFNCNQAVKFLSAKKVDSVKEVYKLIK